MWKDVIYKHLGEYKRKILGIPGNGIEGDKEYEHILPCGMHFTNYMCAQALDESAKIKRHKYWYHLNSSQTMCINFFAGLFDEKYESLNKVVSAIIGKQIEIVKTEFEFTPVKGSTNFDFFCVDKHNYKYYFEIKYTEDGFASRTGGSNPKDDFDRTYKPLIVENQILTDCLIADNWKTFMFKYFQIYRNMVMASTRPDNFSYCIFITMNCNMKTKKDLEVAFSSIGESRQNVLNVNWESLIDKVIEIFSEKDARGNYKFPDTLGYYKEFKNKYIGFTNK